jgi:hypothetical protein
MFRGGRCTPETLRCHPADRQAEPAVAGYHSGRYLVDYWISAPAAQHG